ncbi:MAG TPA: hypothetical protein VFL94_03465 [Actinomycetales bacterium]|nr:hypothetical protein [Actinomycetales bacterium]
MSTSDSSKDDLKKQADEEVSNLPAETAAGNADPAGGVEADPKAYDEEQAGRYADGKQS